MKYDVYIWAHRASRACLGALAVQACGGSATSVPVEPRQESRSPIRNHDDRLHETSLDVVVERENTNYIVSWRICGEGEKFSQANVHTITVVRHTQTEGDPEVVCELKAKGNTASLPNWRYGLIPEGYVSEICEELEQGTKYNIAVLAGPIGIAEFSIETSGQVTMLGTTCRD